MKIIETEIKINARPEKIWAVLTDFKGYPEWNPFIISIAGLKKSGERLSVVIQPPESSPMRFNPTILKFDENKEFRWKGKLFIRGLFDGEHFFTLNDNNDGTTTFKHGEKFSGILIGLFGKTLKKTKNGFVLMNKAIKRRCEIEIALQ